MAVCAAVSSVHSQEPRVLRVGPGQIFPSGFGVFGADAPRAVIGVGTVSAASSRDTLGVLVTTVRAGSPAEKAGIEEGNRIAAINGVSLRLAAADVGDEEMAGIMSRRLSRELDKLKPGDDVDLHVYANGQMKTLKVKTVAPADLYTSSSSASSRRAEDRATLGISLATTGSSRDTIGVFVMSVDDAGPAAKAGIEEGSRIASINGVDVRARNTRDDDDVLLRAANVSRLEREMTKVKPGEDVDLRVYFNGQYRNVKVKAARLSDLPRHNRSVMITSGGAVSMPAMSMQIDGQRIGDDVRRTLERARVFSGMGNRIEW
jgi:predicted metalloprotease with PDZ domain